MEEVIPGLPDEIARECLIRVPYDQFRATRSVCQQWKQELESPHYHRLRRSNGLTRTVVALVQAKPAPPSNSIKHASAAPVYGLALYQPETGEWSSLPPVPGLPHGLSLFCQVVGSGRDLVVVGGWDPKTWAASNEVFLYDFVREAWCRGAPMPGPRRSFFACAAAPGRTVLVAGGHDERKSALRSALAYDIAKDEWAPLDDLAKERDECKGVFLRGRFHVIGGYPTDAQGRHGKCGEAFDLSTWRWGPVEDMLQDTTCCRTCVAGADGKMYMCVAGYVATLENNAWHRLVQLPSDVRVVLHAVSWKGYLMMIGSGRQGGTQVAYTLELKGLRWRRVGMPPQYSGHVQAACCVEI